MCLCLQYKAVFKIWFEVHSLHESDNIPYLLEINAAELLMEILPHSNIHGSIVVWEWSVHKRCMQLCFQKYLTEWNQSAVAEVCFIEGSQWVLHVLWESKVRHILTNRVVYIRHGIQRTWHLQDRWPSSFHTLPLISLTEPAQAVGSELRRLSFTSWIRIFNIAI